MVERKGGVIYEGAPAEYIGTGFVDTPHGRIRATHTIRATEGYTPTLPGLRRSLVPLYSLVLATEPLSSQQRSGLGLEHRLAFNDLRNLRIYAQVTADGRIVFGGRGAPYHFGSAVAPSFDANKRIHAKIYDTLIGFFPALAGISITHRWAARSVSRATGTRRSGWTAPPATPGPGPMSATAWPPATSPRASCATSYSGATSRSTICPSSTTARRSGSPNPSAGLA